MDFLNFTLGDFLKGFIQSFGKSCNISHPSVYWENSNVTWIILEMNASCLFLSGRSKEGAPGTRASPLDQNFFIFMQFSGKLVK